jgi:hypothetical protein
VEFNSQRFIQKGGGSCEGHVDNAKHLLKKIDVNGTSPNFSQVSIQHDTHVQKIDLTTTLRLVVSITVMVESFEIIRSKNLRGVFVASHPNSTLTRHFLPLILFLVTQNGKTARSGQYTTHNF